MLVANFLLLWSSSHLLRSWLFLDFVAMFRCLFLVLKRNCAGIVGPVSVVCCLMS
jgi:hypothetical protein